MGIEIMIFGQLTDITGKDNIVVNNIKDTDSLVTELNKRYPPLSSARYTIAVDKTVISGNTILKGNAVVALLPPFSGG